MQNDKTVDYEAVLADLIARRDKLNSAISGIESMLGIASSPTTSNRNVDHKNDSIIQEDSFFGMTVLEAAKKYLAMGKKPMPVSSITDALKQGGYLFQTGNPLNTVQAVLSRSHSNSGDVVRVSKGTFGLAEWYSNRAKRKKSNGDKSTELTSDPSHESAADEVATTDESISDLL